jgi:hypothetical protein
MTMIHAEPVGGPDSPPALLRPTVIAEDEPTAARLDALVDLIVTPLAHRRAPARVWLDVAERIEWVRLWGGEVNR